jgi:hypothetical protein
VLLLPVLLIILLLPLSVAFLLGVPLDAPAPAWSRQRSLRPVDAPAVENSGPETFVMRDGVAVPRAPIPDGMHVSELSQAALEVAVS